MYICMLSASHWCALCLACARWTPNLCAKRTRVFSFKNVYERVFSKGGKERKLRSKRHTIQQDCKYFVAPPRIHAAFTILYLERVTSFSASATCGLTSGEGAGFGSGRLLLLEVCPSLTSLSLRNSTQKFPLRPFYIKWDLSLTN